MNLKKNNTILIIISIMIVTFTEIIGINMQIAFKYLPIFFAIIILVFFNEKLKEMTDKKHLIIINIIIIVLNLALTNLISGTLGYASILALLIFYKLIDKNNGLQFDKSLIKNIIIWYIIPLVILLGIDAGYSKLISEMSEFSNYWMVNYNYFVMDTIYRIILANIVMVMLVIVFKERIDSKIEININSKKIMITSAITLAVILCIKIILGYIGINDANSKIEKLKNAMQSNNLNTYYELNLEPNLTVEDIGEVQEKERRYMVSFNEILTKGVSSWSELFYKLETNGIQYMVNRGTLKPKDALQKYNESAGEYVVRLCIYKDNLNMQNISNIIIYLIDIIFIFVVYKKIKE